MHGTRVNGEPVKALGPCVVKQDDILQMGASTRLYKVDWLPPSVTEQYSGETVVSPVECTQSNSEKILELSSPNGSKASVRYKFNHQVNFVTRRLPVLEVPFNLSRQLGFAAYIHEEGFSSFLLNRRISLWQDLYTHMTSLTCLPHTGLQLTCRKHLSRHSLRKKFCRTDETVSVLLD